MIKYDLYYSKQYSKELASLLKSGKVQLTDLEPLITKLRSGISLDPKYKDHKLAKHSPKEYKDCREFHCKPNICIVYKIEDGLLKLLRIGPHNKLGLTESADQNSLTALSV